MKTLHATLLTTLALVRGTLSINAQGLLNGGFEDYNPTTQFLAGWNVRYYDGSKNYGAVVGGVSGSLIPFGVSTPQGYYPTIYGKESDPGGMPIGSYYLFGMGQGNSSIVAEQTVVVPENTQTLQYRAFRGFLGGVSVEMDGVSYEPQLKHIVTPGGIHGVVADWWIDARSYAGRQIHLLFGLNDFGIGLDEVKFSMEPIPEPTTVGLFGLGFFGLCCRYWRTKKAPEHPSRSKC